MSQEITIRPATLDDGRAIAEIYNHYVLDTTATFDLTPKSPQDRAAWIAKRGDDHPVLVAEVDGKVVAWGALSPWSDRLGWQHTVEISVYVEMPWRSRGIGRKLMDELMAHAKRVGHHAVMSRIVSENEASIRLATHMGFEEVGRLREVGRKFERWLDVVMLEKII